MATHSNATSSPVLSGGTGPGMAVRLEAEWSGIAVSARMRAALITWTCRHPQLAGLADGEQLRAVVHDRGQLDRADTILSALAVEAAADGGDDPLAARVILQLLLPGVVSLQRRLAGMIVDAEDRDAQVLYAVMETIRSYPWRRRPQRIAANVLLDSHMRIRRGRRQTAEVLVDEFEDTVEVDGAEHADRRTELLELFVWAVTEGVVSADDVLLITRTQIDEEPVEAVADELGVARKSLLRRRQRALACITAAAPRYRARVA
ncbi:MAG: hypothetical protein ACR2JO_13810 [Mycobacteriales bacterium]